MITFKQSNFGQASDAPGPVLSVSASYISDNTAGNVGFAFICNTGGVAPTTVTDSNDNTWCLYSYYNSNVGWVALYVCLSLNAGPNTVTASGTMTSNEGGGPDIIIAEFNCPSGCLVQAYQPNWNDDVTGTSGYGNIFNAIGNSATVMTVMFIYDTANINHHWASINPPTQVDLDSFFQETNFNTGVMAYSNSTSMSEGQNTLAVFSSTVSALLVLSVLGVVIIELS